ncbi:hypothetical protein BDY17DRAFT_290087 [Neohortaea acidophila]|uniref:Phosphoacetylglucosamine mutase n=1 Tax=Neohortaea acidophila TaxID=245834 RepID=A0A6A6Q6S4_9PEZI|nr:uncharacterized protein BDY17DRAFT_290087 [Neohortaea acidophila]KAF2488005.1 hypothetical protein BDY17DRAFT_290087 [Neohortaea acidophila]
MAAANSADARPSESETEKAIVEAAKHYPRANVAEDFQYGTAGFRMKDDLLDYIVFIVGIVATLRSRKVQGQTIGIMITASHNKYQDNGVKVVDTQGEMLEQSFEHVATQLANVHTPQDLGTTYASVLKKLNIPATTKKAHVIFARDTRPSGLRLVKALKAGLEAAGAEYIDYGVLTTPQLHYLVKATNTESGRNPFGEVSEEGYYKKLAKNFVAAMEDAKPIGSVTVDCANGVGAPKLKQLLKHLPPPEKSGLRIRIVNDQIEKPEALNEGCGADFVKTQQTTPAGFNGKAYDRWASFDGDADRIIYYFNEEGPVFRMLDGDRIATLTASFIGELLQKAGLAEKVKVSVIQTAYANGASTRYIEQGLKLKSEFTDTGVKHLHHAALRADIGVYFEANGHGTVLFSPHATKKIFLSEPQSPAQLEALNILRALTDLINQAVGDALSDLLLTEVILAHKGFTVKEWLATYTDMPSRLGKVNVLDRRSYTTVPGSAERKLASPQYMQEKIDEIVAKYKDGRSFVRASGTEDAVRIYGEAAESFDVDNMVEKVMETIMAYSAQGVAQR